MLVDVNKILFEEDEYYRVEYYPIWGKEQRPAVIRLVLQYKYKRPSIDVPYLIRYKFVVIMTNDPENIIRGDIFTISDKAKMYTILEKI